MSATITSITGLQNLTNLQEFYADWNSLTSVNLSGLANLVDVDISDNDIPGSEGDPSLTSVNLTGCTALQTLRLDDSNFSAGIPNLTGLNSLVFFDMDQCSISGAIDISMLPALAGFDLNGNTGLTSVTIFEQVLNDVNISNAALTEASVNDILGWLDGGGETNGFVDLSEGTNAIPTGDGLTAISNLQSKGWNVLVNGTTTTTTTINPGNISLTVTNSSTNFDIASSSDFTVEWFAYYATTAGHPRAYSFGSYFTGGASHAVSIEEGTFYWWVNGSIIISYNVNIENTWTHFCIQRTSGTVRLYINGVALAESTGFTQAIPTNGLPLYIGSEGDDSLSNALFSNFRWNNTTAVYSFNGFTPPSSPLTAVSGTTLLLFQGNSQPLELTDNSGLGQVINNGTGTYNTGNPFAGGEGSILFGTL